jgi:3-oxoacyl-[acyl-carrier-protein] synthase III
MEGRAVFKWAMTDVAKRAAEAVAEAGITPADLDVFIPHQANDRITDVVSRHLKLPESPLEDRATFHANEGVDLVGISASRRPILELDSFELSREAFGNDES